MLSPWIKIERMTNAKSHRHQKLAMWEVTRQRQASTIDKPPRRPPQVSTAPTTRAASRVCGAKAASPDDQRSAPDRDREVGHQDWLPRARGITNEPRNR